MVERKPEEVSNFLKDKFYPIFISLFLIISCESSFDDFDKNLIDTQIELQDFNEKSNLRKKIILEGNNE